MTEQDFLKLYTTTRKANKNKWFTLCETVNGYEVQLKGYNTWIQILKIGALKDGGPMDCSIKVVNQWLSNQLGFCEVLR